MATQQIEALIEGGKASAAPPLGPALGPMGVNIGEVVATINKKTESFKGMQVPVTVVIDEETKEFTISVGTPPASALIKKEAGIDKGSGRPQEDFVADLVIEQIIKIAQMKEDSLLGKTTKEKVKEIIGTCNAMGVKVAGVKAIDAIKLVNEGKFDKEITSGKTELSEEEKKAIEAEQKAMQAELAERHAKEEAIAKEIIDSMAGQERKDIVAKLHEAEIHEDTINKLLPVEEKVEEGAAPKEGDTEKPAE